MCTRDFILLYFPLRILPSSCCLYILSLRPSLPSSRLCHGAVCQDLVPEVVLNLLHGDQIDGGFGDSEQAETGGS